MCLHFHFSKFLSTQRLLCSYTHYDNAQSNKVKTHQNYFHTKQINMQITCPTPSI